MELIMYKTWISYNAKDYYSHYHTYSINMNVEAQHNLNQYNNIQPINQFN